MNILRLFVAVGLLSNVVANEEKGGVVDPHLVVIYDVQCIKVEKGPHTYFEVPIIDGNEDTTRGRLHDLRVTVHHKNCGRMVFRK